MSNSQQNLQVGEDLDDEVRLPDDTLAILQEFLKEREHKQDDIEEDWQLSQFWYNDATKKTLAAVCQRVLEHFNKDQPLTECRIGLLSCPSLYEDVKQRIDNTTIFEFDNRFSKYGSDFVHYDYNCALEEHYLSEFTSKFDLLIIDPPFLSEECLEKTAVICKKIAKSKAHLILCSGKVMEPLAEKHLGLKMSNYEPQHQKNLGNEFAAFTNFDLDLFIMDENKDKKV